MADASLPTAAPPPPQTQEQEPEPEPDFTALDRVVDAAGSMCTVVLRGNAVVHEHPAGSRHLTRRVYSITKSVVGVLVMLAQQDGRLRLDDPVATHVDDWPSQSADVTVRQLMSMSSGRAWSEASDQAMIAARDQTALALRAGQGDAPGSVWRYDNLAAQVLSAVLQSAVGDPQAYAQRRLFAPLSLNETSWERDGAGHVKTYAGIVSSCADIARLGVMMRDGGRFRGRQILPAHAVAELTRPSTDLNAAYGLLWWTNAPGRVVEVRRAAGFDVDKPAHQGRLAPGVPADAFWALGWGNELLAVVPSADTVAVRLGPRPSDPDLLTFETFTAAALGAPVDS